MDTAMEPEIVTGPPGGEFGRVFTLGAVSLLGKFVLKVANTTRVENQDAFLQHVLHRTPGEGLISVSNHTSTLDDPVILSTIVPWSYFLTEHQHKGVRWALCAREICFKNALLSQFFLNGKVLPIDRGHGLDQPVMQIAAQRVREGDWVHIFPEGRVGYEGTMGPFKWGIGKLVCDCMKDGKRAPPIMPFYHSGMGWVMPRKAKVPRPFNDVHVTVGEPVDVSDLTPRCNQPGESQPEVWRDITARVEQSLRELERSAPANRIQQAQQPKAASETHSKQGAALPKLDPAAKDSA